MKPLQCSAATVTTAVLVLPSKCSGLFFDIWPSSSSPQKERILQDDALPPQQTDPIILADLTKDYERFDGQHPLDEEMAQIAADEPEVNAYLALECGKVVSEYYDQGLDETTLFQMFSVTKAWSGLMFGVAVSEGLVSVNETLADIWPDPAVWESVPNATLRQQVTVQQVLQMRGGFVMPDGYLKQVLRDADPFIDKHRLGGRSFEDTLSYHPMVEEQIGLYHYLMAGQLISYILKERTGMIPEEWGNEKVFPHLDISKDDGDYDWYQNWDDVNLGFHGLKINVPSLSKMGSLYLQGGMANAATKVVDKDWIDETFTMPDLSGDPDAEPFGYYWWLGTEPAYCAYGFLGQRLCINYKTNRVLAITSESLNDIFGGGDANETDATDGDEGSPNSPEPTDLIVQKFIFEEPDEPIVCEPYVAIPTATPTAAPIDGSNTTDGAPSAASAMSFCSYLAVLACAVAAVTAFLE